ncbi:hypothetical protein HMPREF1062_01519 [Bacteroides cellulosilyticus CL02T12C19]|uniref:Uncharacterized protein n=2 Tax=Bacteroides cellulosilyticus TaxID=246787 RepID=A0A0P0FW40_9BACE|nr:hypothetical protein BcellWH2_05094 [Bacteroides cellulosilyticus]EIY34593.1 hypothetical protein HMPREF1062_01519 [Bacteroides cellulosilyticus CL02T12C19]KWR59083.1 hypothetical protein AA416_01262 [Bacteroides cellulosilyticus]QUT88528.1 hypothetical protein INE78_00494 [Bacteroides cellulosilyticus]
MKLWLSIKTISFFSFSIFLYREVPKYILASFLFTNNFPVGMCNIIYKGDIEGLYPMGIRILILLYYP